MGMSLPSWQKDSLLGLDKAKVGLYIVAMEAGSTDRRQDMAAGSDISNALSILRPDRPASRVARSSTDDRAHVDETMCPGHESQDHSGPIGVGVYCDGTCQAGVPAAQPVQPNFAEAHSDLVAFLGSLPTDEPFSFLRDMRANLARFGRLTDGQVRGVRNCMAAAVRNAATPAPVVPTEPLTEGRRVVTGTIVSLKWQSNDFGGCEKMLVVEAGEGAGNKVWMTRPADLYGAEKGDQITVTVTVTRSNDDPHFGFGSRPAKGTFLDEKVGA